MTATAEHETATTERDTVRRWMAVGRSELSDSRAAGEQAATQALTGTDVKLLVVFVGITHDMAEVLAGINSVSGGVPLIGASTYGEISAAGPRDGSVVVTAIGGVGFSVSVAASLEVAGRQREAGIEVAETASLVDDLPYKALVILTDGLTRDQEDILRGAYEVVGASLPLFGGASADGWRMTKTYQFLGDQVLTGAVVAATIASEAPITVAMKHGWRKDGEPMIVTKVDDGRIVSLDDEPAMDVYLARLNAAEETYHDAGNFSHFALSRPVGVARRHGEEVRNFSTEVDIEGRTLGGGGHIPQGSLAWLMSGDEDSILEATVAACTEAIDALGGVPPIGMLTFSCAALRAVLGDDGIAREGARLSEMAADIPFAGFYTYGEIARTRGIDGFHNQTFVVLALA